MGNAHVGFPDKSVIGSSKKNYGHLVRTGGKVGHNLSADAFHLLRAGQLLFQSSVKGRMGRTPLGAHLDGGFNKRTPGVCEPPVQIQKRG